jgi:hypothetical protein
MLIVFIAPILYCQAQTWPDSTCKDRPYTKANSDIIYHTADCSVKDISGGIFWDSVGHTNWNNDTIYCPACKQRVNGLHIELAIYAGLIKRTCHGGYVLTKLGKKLQGTNSPMPAHITEQAYETFHNEIDLANMLNDSE